MVDLKAIRHGMDMRQSDVAIQVGISRSAYANIENGKRAPSVKICKKIANILNFEWTCFFSDDEMHEQSNSPGEIACVPPHQEFPGEPLVTQGNPQQFQAAQLSDTARLLIGGDSAAVENESQKRVPQQKL